MFKLNFDNEAGSRARAGVAMTVVRLHLDDDHTTVELAVAVQNAAARGDYLLTTRGAPFIGVRGRLSGIEVVA